MSSGKDGPFIRISPESDESRSDLGLPDMSVDPKSDIDSLSREDLIKKIKGFARAMRAGGPAKCGDPDNPYFGKDWQTLVNIRNETIKKLNEGKITVDEFGDILEPLEIVLNEDPGYLAKVEADKIAFFKEHEKAIIEDYEILRSFISPDKSRPSVKDLTEKLSNANPQEGKQQINKLVTRLRKTSNKAFTWVRLDPDEISKLHDTDVGSALSGTSNWSIHEMRAIYLALPKKFKNDSTGKKAEYLAKFTKDLENALKYGKSGKDDWDNAYYKNPKRKGEGLLEGPFKTKPREKWDLEDDATVKGYIQSELTLGESKAVLNAKKEYNQAVIRQKAGASSSKLAENSSLETKAYELWIKAAEEIGIGLDNLKKIDTSDIPKTQVDEVETLKAVMEKELIYIENKKTGLRSEKETPTNGMGEGGGEGVVSKAHSGLMTALNNPRPPHAGLMTALNKQPLSATPRLRPVGRPPMAGIS